MGESITEGTIVRWFKSEGENVGKDEPLLEISTDKVDAEVPSPAAGTLAKIIHGPGATVAVETVIGVIAGEGEAALWRSPSPRRRRPRRPTRVPAAPPVPAPTPAAPAPAPVGGEEDEGEALRRRSSPLVRRIAAEHGVEIAQVPGTGLAGSGHQGGHPGVHRGADAGTARGGPAGAAGPRRRLTRTRRPAGATLGPTRPFAGDELREPTLHHAAEDRRAHGGVPAHLAPRQYGLRGRHVARRRPARAAKDAFEAQHGIKLTFTPFFMAAADRGSQGLPGGQRVAGRDRGRLPPPHQPRRRGGAAPRPHRSGGQARRGAVVPRPPAGGHRPRHPRTKQTAHARRTSRVRRSPSPTRDRTAASSVCRSSTSPTWPSSRPVAFSAGRW